MAAERWDNLSQQGKDSGRPLSCPLCQSRFRYRDYSQAARTCPDCKIPLGFPFHYRLLLSTAYLVVAAWIMYLGYQSAGPAWLLLGLPFAFVFGLSAQRLILRAIPPKLEPYAGGPTWLKLT